MAASIVTADSITRIAAEEARGAVVVNASHGGVYAAYLAAKLGAAAADRLSGGDLPLLTSIRIENI